MSCLHPPVAIAGLMAAVWTATPALAATINVPGDANNLQTAIIIAADGDEIVVGDGTWTLSLTVTNKELTIRSASGDPSTCFVNTNLGTAFSVVGPDADVRVEGITFNSLGRNVYGIDGARLRMTQCVIENAVEAGGIVFGGDLLRLDECIVRNNVNPMSPGGGVHVFDGSARITRSLIQGNEARWINGYGGGVAVMDGELVMADCIITGNLADGTEIGLGGGVYIDPDVDSAVIASTLMSNNSAADAGGGLYAHNDRVDMTNIVARANTAPVGGGVDVRFAGSDCPRVGIAGAIIDGNQATGTAGGGLHVGEGAAVRVTNATIVFNASTSGGAGVHVVGGGSLEMTNSILGASAGSDVGGPGDIDIRFSSVQDGFTGRGNITDLPLFVDVSTLDYRLSDVSPCIDAGDSTVGFAPPSDIAGDPRSVDDPMTDDTGIASIARVIDMGAFEFQPPVDGPSCVADIVVNGEVDFNDLLTLLAAWGTCP